MRKPVVLIVDDEKLVLDSLKQELKDNFKEIRIETAENAEDAYEIIEECLEDKKDIPIIISDFIMPKIKGDEFLKNAHLKVPESLKIMLTGQADIQAVSNAVNYAGLYRFITKPWIKDDIILTCQEAIKSYYKNRELEQKTKEILELNKDLERKVEIRTAMLSEKNDQLIMLNTKIQSLIDNSEQGFLSFGSDLIIEPGVSLECKRIFEKEIIIENFAGLIAYNEDDEKFLSSVLQDIFSVNETPLRKVLLKLLPIERFIQNKIVHFSYKILDCPQTGCIKIMVILNDITEKKALNDKIQEEQKNLHQAIFALSNTVDIIENVNDYKYYLTIELEKTLQMLDRNKALKLIYRAIHTFKGIFGQINFNYTAQRLHEVENDLTGFKNSGQPFENILAIIDKESLLTILNQDLDRLFIIVGKDLFEKKYDTLEIQKNRLFNLETDILNRLPIHCAKFTYQAIQKLKHINFKEYLSFYVQYVENLSQKLEKPVYPMLISGDDILVDPNLYKNFSKSLVHIFRNALDHGIENQEDRLLAGKDEIATIQCRIANQDNFIVLTISDDGYGIDPEMIKEKLIQKGMIKPDKILTQKELFKYLFHDEFSTKENVTELSGRGVGLSAVLQACRKLNAQVEIQSEPGKGTSFVFKIIKEQKSYDSLLIMNSLFENILLFTKEYFFQDFDIVISQDKKTDATNYLKTDMYSAFFALSGMIRGILIISFNRNMVEMIKEKFAILVTSEDDAKIFHDILTEIANIIIGRAITNLPPHWQMINFSVPVIMLSEAVIKSLEDSIILKNVLYHEKSELSFGLYTGI